MSVIVKSVARLFHKAEPMHKVTSKPQEDAASYERGDTIVEVLIAVAVVAFVLVGAYAIATRANTGFQDTQEQSQATYIAKAQTEWLRVKGGLPTGATCFDQTGAPVDDVSGGGCKYGKHNNSACDTASDDYCYDVSITKLPVAADPTRPFLSTTFIVKVQRQTLNGGQATATIYYRIPIANAAYIPPSGTPPPSTPPPTGVIIAQIDVGNYHVCANSQAGGGYCWGKNDFGALGDGTNNNSSAPNQVNDSGVLAGKVIVGTSAGYNHTCVVDAGGRVYCWGYNSQGQLGNGASGTTNNPNPTAVVTSGSMNSKTIIKVNGGDSHTCALSSDGEIFCWGGNNYGQLGNGSTADSFVPVRISNSGPSAGKRWVDVGAGYAHTCGITDDGMAYCWGFNGRGQLGNGANADASTPRAVSGALRFRQITAGDQHSCAITLAGAAYCWGGNEMGQVGNNSAVDTNAPVAVSTAGVLGGKANTRIAAGYRHTCTIADGNVYCWGNNDAGQLGNGVTSPRALVPVTVVNDRAMAGKSMADIAVGRYSSCAVSTLGSGGAVYCWGKNDDGQLGDGKRPEDSSEPSLVTF